MKIALIAFTHKGCTLIKKLAFLLNADICSLYSSGRLATEEELDDCGSLRLWAEKRFSDSDAIIFASAVGIAVRAIAPFIKDKFTDPAVLSLDENGQYVIPLLSGHVGGANEIARRVANLICATPVISTATDINGVFSVDSWAKDNNLAILDKTAAKEVSAALLDGRSVGFITDYLFSGCLPEGVLNDDSYETGICVSLNETKKPFVNTLRLLPKIITLGIGCRRGTDCGVIKAAVDEALAAAGMSIKAVRALASIDIKSDEQGLLEFAYVSGLPISFYSAEELNSLKGDFSASEFVNNTVGVGNVCERAAAMSGGELIIKKQAFESVTISAAVDRLILKFC